MRLIRGIDAIHAHVGPVMGLQTKRQTTYALEQGRIPGAFKSGRLWFFSPPVFEQRIREAAENGSIDLTKSVAADCQQ